MNEPDYYDQFEARVFWTCKVVIFGAAAFFVGAVLGLIV